MALALLNNHWQLLRHGLHEGSLSEEFARPKTSGDLIRAWLWFRRGLPGTGTGTVGSSQFGSIFCQGQFRSVILQLVSIWIYITNIGSGFSFVRQFWSFPESYATGWYASCRLVISPINWNWKTEITSRTHIVFHNSVELHFYRTIYIYYIINY